jgi:hypothetical protein
MTAEAKVRRRLGQAVLFEHWDSRVPVVVVLTRTPDLRLLIDQPLGRLGLSAPWGRDSTPPVNRMAHVRVEKTVEDGATHLMISVDTDRGTLPDSYAMLMAVADRIQGQGADPLAAIEEALAVWGSILERRGRMDSRAEVGLFGELLIMRGLLSLDPAAYSAWRGGVGEEHDFGFGEADVEVKTTSGERRHHWISGLGQLLGTGDVPLWLLSLQVTLGGDGQGCSLPELIDEVREMADGHGQELIEQNLGGAGWNEKQRDLYVERRRLRSKPLLFRVDDTFPRLTSALLSKAAIETALLRQVDYQIDLTDRPASPQPPTVIADVIKEAEAKA